MTRPDPHFTSAAPPRAYELAFEHAGTPMLLVRGAVVVHANAAFAELAGLAPGEADATDPFRFVHADDAAAARETREALARGRTPDPQRRRLVAADGSVRHLLLRFSLLEEAGTEPLVLIRCEDRTAEAEAQTAVDLFETAFREARMGMALTDPEGRILRVNAAMCALLGRDAEALVTCAWPDFMVPAEVEACGEAVIACLEGRMDGFDMDMAFRRPDGTLVDTHVTTRLVRDPSGAPAHFVSQIADLTEVHRARRTLAETSDRLQAVLDNSPTAIYLRDLEERWVLSNPESCRVVGREEADLLGRRLAETVPADIYDTIAEHDRAVVAAAEPIAFEEDFVDKESGEVHRYISMKFPVRDADGFTVGVGGVSLDVTERERALRQLESARGLLGTVFETAPVGMTISRPLGGGRTEILSCNTAFAAMTGFAPSELVGSDGAALTHPDDLDLRAGLLDSVVATGSGSAELRLVHRDGTAVWVLMTIGVVGAEDGGAPLLVLQALDISERKRFEERLRHLADHDALTGLLSRRRLEEELQREVSRVRRGGSAGALLMLDLDGFKFVNDAFGHRAGDALMARLGGALRDALRESDVLARVGGDEFAVILPDTTAEGAITTAEKLAATVRDNGRVVENGRVAEVSTSVGVTTLPSGCRLDAEALLVEADIAMYEAKETGKDRVVLYRRAHRRREQIVRRTDWIGRLRTAVAEERFVLHAQPVVPLAGAAPRGERYELLLRLCDDDGGLVLPTAFLEHAERHGLIGDIDRWVLAQAVATLHEADRQGRELSLAVNLSGRTMEDPTIVDHLSVLLHRTPITPDRLVVEVTETAAITNVARAAELARQLRGLGCRLALDDFGAGFASFSYLKNLVFDVLKIDGTYIDRLPRSPTDQLVVRAVLDIARGLGADVVAERVRDAETVDWLARLGVDYGQGFFLGRPGPLPPWPTAAVNGGAFLPSPR